MKTARVHAQDLMAFAFNTAMQTLRPAVDGARSSAWLDIITAEAEVQIGDAMAEVRRETLKEALRAIEPASDDFEEASAERQVLDEAEDRIRNLFDVGTKAL